MRVFSVDFAYRGFHDELHSANVHVLAELPSDIAAVMEDRFPGCVVQLVKAIDLPLPIILDSYYQGTR